MSSSRLPVVGGAPRAMPVERIDPARPRLPGRAVVVIAARDGLDVAPFVDALEAAAREAGVALEVVTPHAVRSGRAWLTVIVSDGLPIALWAPLARALEPEADLVIAEPRPGVARALFTRAARAG